MGVNKKASQTDIKQYVTDDLVAKIGEERQALQRAKFTHAITTLDNPAGITAKRKHIARLLTELNNRKKA